MRGSQKSVGLFVRQSADDGMLCMVLAILILCVFPGIALWLPDMLMGPTI